MRTAKVFHKQCVSILGTGFLLFASLFGPQFAPAQTATGTITGAVTDPAGLPIVDVNVVVRNADTGIESTHPTNSSGIYVAPYLQPGNYQVTVAKAGFQTVIEKDIAVHVGDRLTVDAKMRVQMENSTVTVTEEAPLLETEKSEASQTITRNQVEGLPIATRRWENFVLLTPAVTTDGTSGLSSFRGISGLYNANSVDGANNTQAFFSEARGRAIIVSYVYSADSIREFEVSSSNYSAEYGQAAGGVVNAVTKSGTIVELETFSLARRSGMRCRKR
jgi:Carboxypeptidase regulatory-like domain/TonB-dependent Receptor Plug Domain